MSAEDGAAGAAAAELGDERGRVVSGLFDGRWRNDEATAIRGDAGSRAKAEPE